jgi:glyoxylase-like metal-dependent hydrolase (beta-lactamase superfamily II)
VDTYVGNDKDRGGQAPFHMMRTNFLEDLRAAGVPPESVDLVICTHLHVDRVGWNTRLDNGRWVPTFPRARHPTAVNPLSVNLADNITRLGLGVDQLLPLHGGIVPMADLNKAIGR